MIPVPGLDSLVVGTGSPVSLFLPGLGGAISHLRPLGGGVPGTRVFCELAGPDAPTDYDGLAAAGLAVADAYSADRVLAVSLGAGALLRLLARSPARFARVVLFQPSALDFAPPARLAELTAFAELAAAGDIAGLAARLDHEVPAEVRETRQSRDASLLRAGRLATPPGVRLLETLARGEPPLADPTLLQQVSAQVLVVAAEGDDVHPVPVAEAIAAALPYAKLVVFDHPSPLWHARGELRSLISGFLGQVAEGRPPDLARASRMR